MARTSRVERLPHRTIPQETFLIRDMTCLNRAGRQMMEKMMITASQQGLSLPGVTKGTFISSPPG